MPESISFYSYGGVNAADEPLSILLRSHQRSDAGWQQTAPVEASSAKNITFDQQALAKRAGSALIDDSSGVHAASEVILGGFAVGAEQWLVGKKSMYRKASGGSWARAQASGGGDFSWDSDVTEWSAAYLDSYVFIGSDGANNEIAVVNPGSATLKPEMKFDNNYTDPEDASTDKMTGTWPTAAKIVVAFQGRLLMCTGNSIVRFTDIDQPWDLLGGGFWRFHGNVVGLATFVPRGQNELLERLFGFTVNGLQILSGFDGNDTPYKMEGSGVPLSHRSIMAMQNWIVYPTETQTIEAVNLYRFIDLGRRMLNGDGSTGPLDNLNPANSNHAKGFSFFDRRKKQWRYYGPDGATRSTNSMAWGVDVQLEEPGLDEGLGAFERHVRPLWDTISTPGTNAWFVGMYQSVNMIVGVTADGKTYTVNSGLNDLGTLAIEDNWDTPELSGAPPNYELAWGLQSIRSEDKGNHLLDIQYAKDGDPSFTDLYSFTQAATGSEFVGSALLGTAILGDGGRARGNADIDLFAETIRFRLKNQRVSENWHVGLFVQEFQIGAPQR